MGGTEAFTNQSDAIWQLRGVAKGAGKAISLRFFAAREGFGARSGGGGGGRRGDPGPASRSGLCRGHAWMPRFQLAVY